MKIPVWCCGFSADLPRTAPGQAAPSLAPPIGSFLGAPPLDESEAPLVTHVSRRVHLHTQFELPSGATVTPRVPPRSMNCCTAPEALASSTNSLT